MPVALVAFSNRVPLARGWGGVNSCSPSPPCQRFLSPGPRFCFPRRAFFLHTRTARRASLRVVSLDATRAQGGNQILTRAGHACLLSSFARDSG